LMFSSRSTGPWRLGTSKKYAKCVMLAMPQDRVNALRGRPCRGNLPDTSGLCFIFLVPELLAQCDAVFEDPPDERPEPVMLLRGRELLAANDEQPVYSSAP